MNGSHRKKEILALINERDSMSIGELARIFAISKMTVHRDLEALERQGLVKKIHGGAVAKQRGKIRDSAAMDSGSTIRRDLEDRDSCLVCFRPITAHLLYSITLSDGTRRLACCAHCGLLAHLQMKDRITMAITADFLSGRTNPAQNSFFLVNSAVSPCCHPSIITFEERELAARFQKGFGGVICSMTEALEFLKSEMTLDGKNTSCPHCSES